MLKTETFTNTNDFLIAPEVAVAIPVILANAGVTANAEGKKIIKAGTPLYASANVLMNRQTPVHITKATGESVYGVARHDVDVTDGNTNDTLLIFGFVDYLKLDESVQTLVSAETGLAGKVTFIKGRAL